MDQVLTSPSVTDYYLTIQALTPVDPANFDQSTMITSTPPWQIPTLSVLIFLGVLLLGAFGLLLTKSHQLNKMFMLITLAFILSAVPLGLKTLDQPAQYRSLADVPSPPTQVTVSQPTRSALTLNWHSARPDLGAIRLAGDSQLAHAWVVNEPVSTPLTDHSVTISNLQPKTTYYLLVLSGSDWYGNQGQPIQVTTLP